MSHGSILATAEAAITSITRLRSNGQNAEPSTGARRLGLHYSYIRDWPILDR